MATITEATAGLIPATDEARFARVRELQERLDRAPEGPTREVGSELAGALVSMYGAGLERILELVADADRKTGAGLAATLGEDPLVATLLLIHDLHPVPLAERVRQALDSVSPYMESHGGSVELIEVHDGVARIHLRGSCSDCAASSVTLELAVKRALDDVAPDLLGLEVEGMAPQMAGLALPMADNPVGAQLTIIDGARPASAADPPPPTWVQLAPPQDLVAGTMATVTAGASTMVLANVEGTLLAYRDRCPDCGGPVHAGALNAGALSCPGCGRSYFLPRAGRSLDGDGLQLEPVPLLREEGRVMVALGGP